MIGFGIQSGGKVITSAAVLNELEIIHTKGRSTTAHPASSRTWKGIALPSLSTSRRLWSVTDANRRER